MTAQRVAFDWLFSGENISRFDELHILKRYGLLCMYAAELACVI